MKVVINTCFGGFGLSATAIKKIAELNGRDCYFFSNMDSNGNFNVHKYFPISIDDADAEHMIHAFDIPNPNDVLIDQSNWHTMSDKEKEKSNKLYDKHCISTRDYKRDDQILIRVVEELGDKADGRFAQLKIVEIPDGIDYEIDEYDGREHIAETHRTWG